VVDEALDPALYVIHKRHRAPGGQVRRLAVLYVLDGVVYQAPGLHAVASARLARCGHNLRAALEALRPPRGEQSGVEAPGTVTAPGQGSAAPSDAVLRRDAVASAKMNFRAVDQAPEDQLNRILWRAMKGSRVPYPEWAITPGADDDEADK
jgi:hypothetical protein